MIRLLIAISLVSILKSPSDGTYIKPDSYPISIEEYENEFRVWVMDVDYYSFYNDSLNEGLIYQIYFNSVSEIFHLNINNIPAEFIESIEYVSAEDNKLVLNDMKNIEKRHYSMSQSDGIKISKPYKLFIDSATIVNPETFVSSKGFKINSEAHLLNNLYGKPHNIISKDAYKILKWEFSGEMNENNIETRNYIDSSKTYKEIKVLNTFSYSVTAFVQENKVFALKIRYGIP